MEGRPPEDSEGVAIYKPGTKSANALILDFQPPEPRKSVSAVEVTQPVDERGDVPAVGPGLVGA